MYGVSKAITPNKKQKNLNVMKQPCHARDQKRAPLYYFYHKQNKKFRRRTNDKKTNIFTVKTIASGTIVSSTNQEGQYKQRR